MYGSEATQNALGHCVKDMGKPVRTRACRLHRREQHGCPKEAVTSHTKLLTLEWLQIK